MTTWSPAWRRASPSSRHRSPCRSSRRWRVSTSTSPSSWSACSGRRAWPPASSSSCDGSIDPRSWSCRSRSRRRSSCSKSPARPSSARPRRCCSCSRACPSAACAGDRPRPGSPVLVALAVAFKGFPAVLLVPMLVARRWRLAAMTAGAVALLGVASLVIGSGGLWSEFVDLSRAIAEVSDDNPYNAASGAVADALGLPGGAALGLVVGCVILVAFVAGVLAVDEDEDLRWSATLPAALLVVPQVWGHYLATAVAMVVVAAAPRSKHPERWLLGSVAAARPRERRERLGRGIADDRLRRARRLARRRRRSRPRQPSRPVRRPDASHLSSLRAARRADRRDRVGQVNGVRAAPRSRCGRSSTPTPSPAGCRNRASRSSTPWSSGSALGSSAPTAVSTAPRWRRSCSATRRRARTSRRSSTPPSAPR